MKDSRNRLPWLSQALPVLLSLLLLTLTGCLQTENRKVQLQDDIVKEKLAKKSKNLIRKTYEELVTESMARRKALVISESLYREEVHRETTRRAVAEVLARVPKDPFVRFEAERARVLGP